MKINWRREIPDYTDRARHASPLQKTGHVPTRIPDIEVVIVLGPVCQVLLVLKEICRLFRVKSCDILFKQVP